MQLGTRWPVGAAPAGRLPEAVLRAVADVEAELTAAAVDTTSWGWTLTYLEGLPVVELDDGTTIHYLPTTGEATITAS